MNRYGTQAMEHWKKHLSERYSQIEDPDKHFSNLGEEIEEEIESLSLEIAGDDPPNENYLAKLGRLNEARLSAESAILREKLPSPELED